MSWYKDDKTYLSTGNDFFITDAKLSDAGHYYCRSTNAEDFRGHFEIRIESPKKDLQQYLMITLIAVGVSILGTMIAGLFVVVRAKLTDAYADTFTDSVLRTSNVEITVDAHDYEPFNYAAINDCTRSASYLDIVDSRPQSRNSYVNSEAIVPSKM